MSLSFFLFVTFYVRVINLPRSHLRGIIGFNSFETLYPCLICKNYALGVPMVGSGSIRHYFFVF